MQPLFVKVKNGAEGTPYFTPKDDFERIKAHGGNFLLKKFIEQLTRVDEVDYSATVTGGVVSYAPVAPE